MVYSFKKGFKNTKRMNGDNEEDPQVHKKCEDCGTDFSSSTAYYRHRKTAKYCRDSRKNKETVKEEQEMLKLIRNTNNLIMNLSERLKQIERVLGLKPSNQILESKVNLTETLSDVVRSNGVGLTDKLIKPVKKAFEHKVLVQAFAEKLQSIENEEMFLEQIVSILRECGTIKLLRGSVLRYSIKDGDEKIHRIIDKGDKLRHYVFTIVQSVLTKTHPLFTAVDEEANNIHTETGDLLLKLLRGF